MAYSNVASGFLTALGQAFGGYAQDRQRRDTLEEKNALLGERRAATQASLLKQQQDAERQSAEDALKGIRVGTAPNQGLLTDASTLAGSFAGPLGGLGVNQMQSQNPEDFDPSRFQQVTPSRYLDTARTPDVIAQKRQEIAARLAEKREQMRQDFEAKQQAAREAAADRRLTTTLSAQEERDIRRTANGQAKQTEFSNKAALVTPRAEQAFKILEPYYSTGVPAKQGLGRIPVVGNYMLSEDEQKAAQAAETVASAILRLESGAAISESEIKSYAKQFLPQPGDDDDTRMNKRALLKTQLERMRAAAAPSMGRSASPGIAAHVDTIDEMIRKGMTDAQIKVELRRQGVQP